MNHRVFLSVALAVLATTGFASHGAGQIQASEHAVVAQTIDGTTLTIEYHRPQVRGREIFGALVPWDVVWTPGANWATTLDVSADLQLNGVEVPAGTYSVWAIPREDRWLMMLNPEPEIMHFVKPDSSQATVHIPAEPEQGPPAEMLTWSFSEVRGDFARLTMAWDDTHVPMQVEVEPTRTTLTADEIAQYVGTYEMTVVQADPAWPAEATLEVFEEERMLRGRMSFTIHPVDDEVFDLVRMGDTRFNPGLYRDGEFFNVEIGVGFDFTLGPDNQATGFAFVAPNGMSFGEGTRVER